MQKQRMKLSLDKDAIDYIKDYMEENNITYTGDAISKICTEHQKQKGNEWSLKYISEVVAISMKEVYRNELNKIRVGTNNADRNTQILIELLNGVYFNEGYGDLISTNIQEAQGLKTAKETVQNRIENQRQKKLT